ncbi:MAG: hypothetical protein UX38_C0009G0006 [Microgenomates group bacterium GW2011_GWC1_46_16]|nr:MAG: hypothetical protein UX38_C0009G0006 [Microgenomates group bacterium GW2011_GWC1_46_16]
MGGIFEGIQCHGPEGDSQGGVGTCRSIDIGSSTTGRGGSIDPGDRETNGWVNSGSHTDAFDQSNLAGSGIDEVVVGIVVTNNKGISVSGGFGMGGNFGGVEQAVGAIGITNVDSDSSANAAVAGIVNFQTMIIGGAGTAGATGSGGNTNNKVVVAGVSSSHINTASAKIKPAIIDIAVGGGSFVSGDENAEISVGNGAGGGQTHNVLSGLFELNWVPIVSVAGANYGRNGKFIGVINTHYCVTIGIDVDGVTGPQVGSTGTIVGDGGSSLDLDAGGTFVGPIGFDTGTPGETRGLESVFDTG